MQYRSVHIYIAQTRLLNKNGSKSIPLVSSRSFVSAWKIMYQWSYKMKQGKQTDVHRTTERPLRATAYYKLGLKYEQKKL